MNHAQVHFLSMSTETQAYGSWQSPLDLRRLFEAPSPPQHPHYYLGRYYWLENRPGEGGRSVLVELEPGGAERVLTPDGFSVRSRVHEYGGKCFTFGNGRAYFLNDPDRRLYAQALIGEGLPEPVSTDSGRTATFADLSLSPTGRRLIGVLEQARNGRENANSLISLDLDGVPAEPQPIAQGADFYANPVVDGAGNRLAWIQWDHPDMPWDRSQLVVADVMEDDSGLVLDDPRVLVDETHTAVCQLGFYGQDLVFAMDRDDGDEPYDDYWNLFVYRNGAIERLSRDAKEYGSPHWVFGERNHAALGAHSVVARRIGAAGEEMVRINRTTGKQDLLSFGYDSFAQLNEGKAVVLAMASSPTQPPRLIAFDEHRHSTVKAAEPLLSSSDISEGEPVRFPTRDGQTAHAYYYAPVNPGFEAPAGSLPPLLVMVHGGPTSRANRNLDLSRQYWTGIGFAVLDVNHRGSTGYGRRYRQHLLGRWGRVDVDDIADGIDHLVDRSLVDGDKVFIRGKSAGGYAVLRALTEYPDRFRGGACYYGIGNLATLAAHTHKFEACYTDRLVGETYDPVAAASTNSEYYQRSPIHFMHRIESPLILFQGLEDAVVPPEVSREVVRTLSARGVEHEYVEYPGEGHGFRSSETNIDAIRSETAFYRRVLRLASPRRLKRTRNPT